MKALSLFALLAVLALPLAAQEFPADGFAPGWTHSGPVEAYGPAALYNVIDGGAELFLELGFAELRIQKYAGAGAEIAVEHFMESAAAALAVYLLKCSGENSVAGIDARNSGDRFQFAVLKNNYFIFINNFSGREELLPVMTALAQRLGRLDPGRCPGERPGDPRPRRGCSRARACCCAGPIPCRPSTPWAKATYCCWRAALHLPRPAPTWTPRARAMCSSSPPTWTPPWPARRSPICAATWIPTTRSWRRARTFSCSRIFQDRFGVAQRRGPRIEVRVKLAQRPPRPVE